MVVDEATDDVVTALDVEVTVELEGLMVVCVDGGGGI